MTKNTWLMRFTTEYQTQVANLIINSNSCHVSLLTTNRDTRQLLSIPCDHNIAVLDNNDICTLSNDLFKVFELYNHYRSKSFFDLVSPQYSYMALQMLERFMRFTSEISFEESNYLLHHQAFFWSELVTQKRPDIVIFMDIPHMYYEVLLMGILHQMKIPFLTIGNLNETHYFIRDQDTRFVPSNNALTYPDALRNKMNLTLRGESQSEDLRLNNQFSFPKYFKRGLSELFASLFSLSSNTSYQMGYFLRQGPYSFDFNTLINEQRCNSFYYFSCILSRINYHLISSSTVIPAPKTYCYLPLSSGYENTLHPEVSPLNWMLIVEKCLSLLPPSHLLILKEHPAQFRFRCHQPFSRHKNFYTSILGLDPRIRFAPLSSDPFLLIKDASMVFSLPFSSAYNESLSYCTPVYSLGINPETGMSIPVNPPSQDSNQFYYPGSLFFGTSSQAQTFANTIIETIHKIIK